MGTIMGSVQKAFFKASLPGFEREAGELKAQMKLSKWHVHCSSTISHLNLKRACSTQNL
jgi:hypothetical protein